MEVIKETIGNKEIKLVIDDDGTRWYPLKRFYHDFLYRTFNIAQYRDTTFIDYMKVFELETEQGQKYKAWYCTEEGIKLIIRNIPLKTNNKQFGELQQIGLKTMLEYFNIKRAKKLRPQIAYMVLQGERYKYDKWELICFDNDPLLGKQTPWQLCSECDKYFPHTHDYFYKRTNGELDTKCKECCGGRLKCHNELLDEYYTQGGIQLIEAINKYDVIGAFKAIHNKNPKSTYTPNLFRNQRLMIRLINYLRPKYFKEEQDFTYYNISKFFNMKPQEIKALTNDYFRIGLYSSRTYEDIIVELLKEIFPRNRVITKGVLGLANNKDILAGLLTEKGLFIFTRRKVDIPYAKTFMLSKHRKKARKTILKVKEKYEI